MATNTWSNLLDSSEGQSRREPTALVLQVPTFLHLPAKWETVRKHLAAAEAGNKAQMFLTYSSGAGILAYPISVARHINAQLLDHIALKAGKPRRYGIVAMDFPASPLLQTIINFN